MAVLGKKGYHPMWDSENINITPLRSDADPKFSGNKIFYFKLGKLKIRKLFT